LSVAIVVSLCVSLTTTPMMCAQFLKSEKEIKHGKCIRPANGCFSGAWKPIPPDCAGFLRHQPFMLILTAATICLSAYLYFVIPKGFFPATGYGADGWKYSGSQDTSFPAMQEKLKQYTDIIMSDPAVKSMIGQQAAGRKIRVAWRSN